MFYFVHDIGRIHDEKLITCSLYLGVLTSVVLFEYERKDLSDE